MKFFRTITTIIISIFFSFLLGCATAQGTYILTGEARPAINIDEVKIYLETPSQYEIIGLVEASCEVDTTKQKTQDMVINELKKQAAKIGANGVILINTNTTSTGGVFVYNVYVANEVITAKGQAVYIIQK